MPFGLVINDENGLTVFNADTHRALKFVAELYPTGYQFYGSFCNAFYIVPEQYRTSRHLIHLVNGNHIVRGDSLIKVEGKTQDGISYNTNDYTQEKLKAALKPAIVVSL
ncbi:hypothetical protein [Acinetobacter pittii]|uniref:hypothetical protein n=1 Tax=Acinetobacter pittii TaxID=48296 RepID=UPI000838D02D|nr:hypothetical protein [Acinetobacter pittii]OCY17441.1 hypothetical protein BFR62_15600 [Acinetobacter pittii]